MTITAFQALSVKYFDYFSIFLFGPSTNYDYDVLYQVTGSTSPTAIIMTDLPIRLY